MDGPSEFLLGLYRAAREREPTEFRQRALLQLHSRIAFSAAVWGDARRVESTPGVIPTSLHRDNLDGEFLVNWARMQPEDPAVPVLLANLGRAVRVHVPSFYGATPELADLGERYEVQSVCSTVLGGLGPNQVHWLSLYSPHAESAFTYPERDWLEFAMPHLTEAWRINEALFATRPSGLLGFGIAVAESSHGALIRADAGFLDIVGREWSGFDGRIIPAPLMQVCKQRSEFVYLARESRFDGRCFGELVYLSARRKTEAESLTSRQLDIANLYAQGLSNKEIARRRAISPATVRNHLAHVYEALGVHGRLEMIARLGDVIDKDQFSVAGTRGKDAGDPDAFAP
jgi:DNA-binding CsgD family transcriptional regulator